MTEVYFNELSAKGNVQEKDVKEVLGELLSCLQHLHEHNIDSVIVDRQIGECLITSRRTLFQLVGDETVFDNDKTAFLLDSFYEKNNLREEIEDNNILSSKCKGFDALGLTLASDSVNKSLALSLNKCGWDNPVYDIQLDILVEDGSISTQTTSSNNASTEKGLRGYTTLFPGEPIQAPKSGKLLSSKLASLFPHLVFSADSKEFIKRCNSKEMTTQIYLKLQDLNKVALELKNRPLNPSMFTSLASPESNTRDNMDELDILFDDGIVRHCSWHLRYTPGAGRIHFSSDAGDGKTIYVGYVGPKIKP